MAAGLLGGLPRSDDDEPEVEAPGALADADPYADVVASKEAHGAAEKSKT